MLREGIRAGARVGGLALLILVATTAAAPSSLADTSGAITGTVTEAAAPHAPIAGIQVCAFSRSESAGAEGPEEPPCSTTGSSGEYTIAALPSGQYTVGFRAAPNSHLNYITQYYHGKTNGEAAEAVVVSAPATTTGIDAELAVGGEISGTITDASSGAGIENAFICAELNENEGNCILSAAGGAYTIPGLPGGNYTVYFIHPGYQVQVYDGKANPTEANLVAVVPGEITAGIDAALKPGASPTTTPPRVLGPSGGPGQGSLASKTIKPVASVLSRRLILKHHTVRVRVRCAQARCTGSMRLLRTASGSGHARPMVASAHFSIAAGDERVVVLRVPRRYGLLLARVRRHAVALRLELSVNGGKSTDERVLVG